VRGRFDGVEAHVLYPSGLVGLIVARLRGIPVLAYAHGTDVRSVSLHGRFYRALVGIVVRHADLLVTNSSDMARKIGELGGNAEVIPPGFDPALFRPSARRPVDDRRVLYLGGASPNKGIDVARALADTIVGPGVREVTPNEVADLIAQHDVVLMPSHAEGFGMVAVEAIASGRWVVARAVGGLTDIIQDGVNGTLVRDGNFAAALANVPDYDPFAIARTVERFSLDRWQEAMADAWRRLLADRRA
jgi:glycosyltransferase involved in cell wall biosynthesis